MKKRRVFPTCSDSTSSATDITEELYNDSEAVDMELQQHSVDDDMLNPESEIELVSRNECFAAETTVGDTESEDYKQKLADTIGELSNIKELLLKTAHDLSEAKKQLLKTEGQLSGTNDHVAEIEQQLVESKEQLTT